MLNRIIVSNSVLGEISYFQIVIYYFINNQGQMNEPKDKVLNSFSITKALKYIIWIKYFLKIQLTTEK